MHYQLSAEFAEALYELCAKEARRIRRQGVATVRVPDAFTGLDQSKPLYVDLLSTTATVELRKGWYTSQVGITGVPEVEVAYFEGALTFIPWTNIANTRAQ